MFYLMNTVLLITGSSTVQVSNMEKKTVEMFRSSGAKVWT